MLNKKEDGCYICGNTNVELHHIFHGRGYRKMSDLYGMCVYLCHNHHNEPPYGVHFNREFDIDLKVKAQEEFEEKYGHDKFMEIFGRNYL